MTDDRNLSSEHRNPDRGERASIAENGEARCSGSGAGGSNPGEDYEDDASGGGGNLTANDSEVVRNSPETHKGDVVG